MAPRRTWVSAAVLLCSWSATHGTTLPGCCSWGNSGVCGDKCGSDGSTWCNEADTNCVSSCGGSEYLKGQQPIDNCKSTPSSQGCCSHDGAKCDDKCSVADGSSYCHESSTNCQGSCRGTWLTDGKATTDNCAYWDQSCFMKGYDAGGSQNSCGYAKEVMFIGGPDYDFSQHSWIASKSIPTMHANISGASACQTMCSNSALCAYFVYNAMAQSNKSYCLLKRAYKETSCLPLYQASKDAVAGPSTCNPLGCYSVDHDYGAGGNACGYAKEVQVIGGPGYNFSAHSWIQSKNLSTMTVGNPAMLDEAADCQALCAATPMCGYFVFNKAAQGIGRCILKEAYSNRTCVPEFEASTGNTAGPAMCARSSCVAADYDVGGSKNDCGFAKEVMVIGGPGYNFSAHSWIESKKLPTKLVANERDLDSPSDCQEECAANADCSFYAYNHDAQGKGRCILKKSYPWTSCKPIYQSSTGTHSGPKKCEQPGCYQDEQDVGGSLNSCGYATEIKVYGGPGYNFSAHGWIASKNVPTEEVTVKHNLDEAADCQILCGQNANCGYFVFKAAAHDGKSRCILKEAYSSSTCQPLYQHNAGSISGPVLCLDATAQSCFAMGADAGGDANSCGFAKELKVVGGKGYDFSKHSWIASKKIPTEEAALTSAQDCQKMCKDLPGCSLFVYSPTSQKKGRCILKHAYSSPACQPIYQPFKNGIAGPSSCMDAVSCAKTGHDMGGDLNSCGHAKEVKVYGGIGYNFSAHSWIAAKNITTEVYPLNELADCQALCRMDAKCAYSVYNRLAQGKGRCILKEAYSKAGCMPLFQMSTGNDAVPNMCLSAQSMSCFLMDHDVGGGSNSCGSAPEKKVIGGPGYDFSQHSWIASKNIPTQEAPVPTIKHCQDLCDAHSECDYFAFSATAQKKGRCILKGKYSQMTCMPLYEPHMGTISGPSRCSPPGCHHVGKDFGGSDNSCGFAKEVKIFGGPGYPFTQHSWIKTKGIPTEEVNYNAQINEAGDCQALCGATTNCSYFAFKKSADHGGFCVLKEAYKEASCTPLYTSSTDMTAGPVMCLAAPPAAKETKVVATVTGVDYTQITDPANAAVLADFKDSVKDGILQHCPSSVTKADITVDVKPGSVIVESTIRTYDDSSASTSLASTLESASANIVNSITTKVKAVPSITSVSTGPIGVSNVAAAAPTTTTNLPQNADGAPHSAAPVAVIAFFTLLLGFGQ